MNINEIAALAGVSRATVSRYLNNGYVSAEKKEQIKKVIEETGYQPSAQAQMLRTKKTGFIGVVVPQIDTDSISRMVQGMSTVLREREYQLLLADTNNDIKEEIHYLKQFRQNCVDGIIFIGTVSTKEHVKVMKELTIPVVVLSQCVRDYSCVYCDDYGASKELTKLALQTGKNPAYIGGFLDDEAAGQERVYGFLDANLELERTIREEYCTSGPLSMENGYENAKKLLEMDPTIDTLICAADEIAMGAMRYLKECKKQIPKDIQVAGFGDTIMGKVCEPKLSSVRYYYKNSGEEAAHMLLNMMEDTNFVRKEMKMGYQIIKGDSLRN